MDQKNQEKRYFQRKPVQIPIQFINKETQSFGGCLSADLSESGVRTYFPDFIPHNEEMILELKIDQTVLRCNAHVVWTQNMRFSDEYQVAMEFDTIGPESDSRVKLREFINN